jgi:tetratricopeptide (TPR) repeat protein
MPTTLRLISDRRRHRGSGNPVRRALALVLAVAVIAAAYFVFSRDIDWENRSRKARQQGLNAYYNGDFGLARKHYEAALADNPYDWMTHRSLANLLFRRLNEPEDALRHYLYSEAFSPELGVNEEVKGDVEIIRLVRSGELENPRDAIDEMFQSVDAGAIAAFMRRLSPNLREDRLAYWDGWNRRGRGVLTRMVIVSNNNGFYDAFVEMQFADGAAMSMHLICQLRDIWRVELSFP